MRATENSIIQMLLTFCQDRTAPPARCGRSSLLMVKSALQHRIMRQVRNSCIETGCRIHTLNTATTALFSRGQTDCASCPRRKLPLLGSKTPPWAQELARQCQDGSNQTLCAFCNACFVLKLEYHADLDSNRVTPYYPKALVPRTSSVTVASAARDAPSKARSTAALIQHPTTQPFA